MQIVMFQYNRTVSAILQENAPEREDGKLPYRQITNRFLANGYEDRLLWEEADRPRQPKEYCIPGNWQ